MSAAPRHKHELVAIVSLLVGVFVGLTLLPWDVTGPAGRFVGGTLWKYLGSGAALVPVLGIVIGLAGFGRLRQLGLRRVSVLMAGLVFLIPFAVALVTGVKAAQDLPANYDQWTFAQRAVGLGPAAVAVQLTTIVGMAGAMILGLIALSGLTLYTMDWHPFRRLGPHERKRMKRDETGSAAEPDAAEGGGSQGGLG